MERNSGEVERAPLLAPMLFQMAIALLLTKIRPLIGGSGRNYAVGCRQALLLMACLFFLAGCQSPRPRAPQSPAPAMQPVTSIDYRTGFPDILEVTIADHPESSGRFLVMPDGTVELGKLCSIQAEGKTVQEIGRQIAEKSGIPADRVDCRVSQARSRVIHVFGPAGATPMSLPYAGSEHISEALVRAGILPSAHMAEVTVIRRHTAMGLPEETFRADFAAIRAGDPRTNITLEPNDEIHVNAPHPPFVDRILTSFFKPAD